MFESAQLSGASKNAIVRFCDALINVVLVVLAALMPLFFLPWTIEVVELNKQLLLVSGAALAGMAWFGKMLLERRVEYRRSVVNVMVVLYAVLYVASAWMSDNRYLSFVGDFGQEKAGVLTLLSLVTLYFVTVNSIRTAGQASRLVYVLVGGGVIAALFALLQGFGAYILPFQFARSASFNTIGTVASVGIYMAALVSLCGGLLLSDQGKSGRKLVDAGKKVFLAVSGIVALVLIAAVDFWPVTVPLLLASAMVIAFAFVHARSIKNIGGITLPIAGLILAFLLLFFRLPLRTSFPSEVMPSFKASADIALGALREDPLLGSGPGTFLYDYAKYRATEVNQTAFWNVRFDRGASRFLTLLATTGYLGAITWVLLALTLLVSAGKRLMKTDEETWHSLIAVFSAWVVVAVSRFTYSSNIALEFLFWMLTALLVVLHRREFMRAQFEESPRAAMGVSFVFILGAVLVLSGVFVEGQRYAAEIAFAKAIRTDAASGPIDEVIDSLSKAVSLNTSNDVYRRNLAIALLMKADRQAQGEVSVARNEGEKDAEYQARVASARQERVQEVTRLTADAVATAKSATEINPVNVANWSVLGSVYQSIMSLATGADVAAEAAFAKAVSLEPNNPALHTELGKVYLFQSDVARQAQDSKDEQIKADATKRTDELLQKAIDEFNKAVELKSDYAPARYQLSLALDRQGKLKEAIAKMEDVVRLNPQDVGVGFQLALMYFRDDRKDEARRLLEQVVRLAPNYSNARWYLGSMYEENGELDKAIAEIQKVLELNPDNELVKKKLEQLGQAKTTPPAGDVLPPPVDQPVENQGQPEVGP